MQKGYICRQWLLSFMTAFVCVCLPFSTHAHGDLHERILIVTKEIKAHPDSAYLYLKRGELLYQHEEYKKALKDFKKSEKLGYADSRLLFAISLAEYKRGRTDVALAEVNELIRRDPDHVKALRLKGQILFDMEQFAVAAGTFEEVILRSETTLPENYLEASYAWENSGIQKGNERAIVIIHTGMQTIGPLRTFLDRLVEISLRNQDFDAAIGYQTEIIGQSERKEWAYYQRALTYIMKGDMVLARADLQAADTEILRLPQRLQSQKNVLDLKEKITFQFESLLPKDHREK